MDMGVAKAEDLKSKGLMMGNISGWKEGDFG